MVSVTYLLLAALAVASVASAAPESRIVGGTPTTIQQFPYVVAIKYHYPNIGITIQRCVGSLISSWHVVTSGFCFTGANLANMNVRAGSTYSVTGGTLVAVSHFVKHPSYVQSPRAGDIAILILARPLGISATVQVLYLPPPDTFIPDGTSLKVASWGFEQEGGTQLDQLKTIFLNKVNVGQCQAQFAASAAAVTISDDVICAQAAGRGTCMGDSGAPMAINNVLIGVQSFYQSCDDAFPSVFSRVDRYTNWIMSVAGSSRSGGDGIVNTPIVL